MEQKHTPGPWSIGSPLNNPNNGFPIRSESGEEVAVVADWSHRANIERANARLIAAAPDLLEAAIHAEETLSLYVAETGEPGAALDALRAAIAKAKGDTDAGPS
jgi:cytochrome c556